MSLIGDSALADYYLPLIRADLLLSSQLLFLRNRVTTPRWRCSMVKTTS